jgi:glycosyltransferase involved in cell wall biosynthesis
MNIAFYAPLKAPSHATPSGDRRMAELIMAALSLAGHDVTLASTLRSYDGTGDAARQVAIRMAGEAEASALARRYRMAPAQRRPAAWFTYHLYHKAPDWIGPAVSEALGVPYLIAEASSAPKRAAGPWASGYAAAAAAIARADAVMAMTVDDALCLRPLVRGPDRLFTLPPFLDPAPYDAARRARAAHRTRIAGETGLDAAVPWLLAVAMMRRGDKLASYRRLGAALGRIADRDWRLLVVGDGPARAEVAAAFDDFDEGRIAYAGAQAAAALPAFYAAADIYVWPAVNEAYGMALLEAQATGVPVVAGRVRGVADIVRDGRGGLLTPPGHDDAFAAAVDRLLADQALRSRFGRSALEAVEERHSMTAAADILATALAVSGAGA